MDPCKKPNVPVARNPVVRYLPYGPSKSFRKSPFAFSAEKLFDATRRPDDRIYKYLPATQFDVETKGRPRQNTCIIHETSEGDLLSYDEWLVAEIKKRDPSAGLKNELDGVARMDFDWPATDRILEDWKDKIPLLERQFTPEIPVPEEENYFKLSGFETLVKLWNIEAWKLDAGL